MGIKTVPHPPYSPDLGPCDFWLFPKLRGCRYETFEEMKEAVTKVIDTLTQEDFDWGLPEVVGTVEQVHCSRRRLLRRGLEFHVCTINKSAHTKKHLETYRMPLVPPEPEVIYLGFIARIIRIILTRIILVIRLVKPK